MTNIEKMLKDYPLGDEIWVLDRYQGNQVFQGKISGLSTIRDSCFITVKYGKREKTFSYQRAPDFLFKTREDAYRAIGLCEGFGAAACGLQSAT